MAKFSIVLCCRAPSLNGLFGVIFFFFLGVKLIPTILNNSSYAAPNKQTNKKQTRKQKTNSKDLLTFSHMIGNDRCDLLALIPSLPEGSLGADHLQLKLHLLAALCLIDDLT